MNKEILFTQYEQHGTNIYYANIFDTKRNKRILEIAEKLDILRHELLSMLEIETGTQSSTGRVK